MLLSYDVYVRYMWHYNSYSDILDLGLREFGGQTVLLAPVFKTRLQRQSSDSAVSSFFVDRPNEVLSIEPKSVNRPSLIVAILALTTVALRCVPEK